MAKTEYPLMKKAEVEERFPVLAKGDEIREVLEDNYPRGLTLDDLLQVRFTAGGGTTFSIIGRGREVVREVDELVGVCVYHTPSNRRWAGKVGEGEGGPPLCYSADGVTGVGDPGGNCLVCPMKQWGDGGEPPACNERRDVYLLESSTWLPLLVSFPRKSAHVFEALLSNLSQRCLSLYAMIVRFSLVQETNPQKQTYAKLEAEIVGQLGRDELALSRAYRKTLEGSLRSVTEELARQEAPKSVHKPEK